MRVRPRPAVVAGIFTATLLGAGVLAVVIDTVVSPGNHLTSPDIGDSDILEVAHTYGFAADVESCGEFSGADAFPMQFGDDRTQTSDGALPGDETELVQFDNFCLRNVGDQTIDVYARFVNVVSTDAGCSPGEAVSTGPADPADADCSPGAAGELDESYDWVDYYISGSNPYRAHGVLRVGANFDGVEAATNSAAPFRCWREPAAPSCIAVFGGTPAVRKLATIAPGRTVTGYFAFTWADVRPPSQGRDPGRSRQSSQTDDLVWDVRFEAQPVERTT